MSLNRFVGLGVFALSSSVLLALGACDDSATTAAPIGQGGTSATTTTPAQGSTTATGSGGTTTTSTTTAGACPDLLVDAAKSATKDWIGGDGAVATDNPCGVQGAIYVYSDKGLNKTAGDSDDSVQVPALTAVTTDAADKRDSACDGTKCCISGSTVTWGTPPDYTLDVWGGGLGIVLNGDSAGVKSAFAGTAKGFNVGLSGSLNGQKVRFKLTQSKDDAAAPFKEVATLTLPSTTKIDFTGTDIKCPTAAEWGATNAYVLACKAPTATPYDLQVEVVGGDVKADFNICITSVTAIP